MSEQFSNPLETRYKWNEAQHVLVSENKNNIILKTHNAAGKYDFRLSPLPELALKAIYIVRDPRDVAFSYSKHFNTSIGDAVRRINSETHALKPDKYKHGKKGAEFTSSWKNHVNGWRNCTFPTLNIKYEDLSAQPAEKITKILQFMTITP